MVLVALKCPNCGGEVNLDEKMKQGFCVFCGTKLVNESISKNIKMDTSDQVRSLIIGAKNHLCTNDRKTALEFIDKAMELRSDLPDIWYLKSLAVRDDNIKNAGACYSMAEELSKENGCEYFTSDDYDRLLKTAADAVIEQSNKYLRRIVNSSGSDSNDIENVMIYLERSIYCDYRQYDPSMLAAMEECFKERNRKFNEKIVSINEDITQENIDMLVDIYSNDLCNSISACMFDMSLADSTKNSLSRMNTLLGQKWCGFFGKKDITVDKKHLAKMKSDVVSYSNWLNMH